MADKITTTLERVRDEAPCKDVYKKLCKLLGGVKKYGKSTPVTFRQIYKSNGYDDTLLCLRTIDEKWFPLLRHFAVDCAEDVIHLANGQRLHDALAVVRRHADGLASDEELTAARSAARSASSATASAAWAARDAAWAAWSARDVAWAVGTAASAAASAAAKEAQMERLFKYCKTGKRVTK